MTNISEKLGYIRGLMDGLKLNPNDDTVKVLTAINEALGDMALEISKLRADYTELNDYMEHIDGDLADLERARDDDSDDEEDFDIDDGEWSFPYFKRDADESDNDNDEDN